MQSASMPKSMFYIFLSLGMAILAVDFLFVYIPLSGWIIQAVLVGVYIEYLKPKKTLLLVAVMEIFFMFSYGGSIAVATILTIFGTQLFLPLTAAAYFGLVASIFLFGVAANSLFHKMRLFERLNRTKNVAV